TVHADLGCRDGALRADDLPDLEPERRDGRAERDPRGAQGPLQPALVAGPDPRSPRADGHRGPRPAWPQVLARMVRVGAAVLHPARPPIRCGQSGGRRRDRPHAETLDRWRDLRRAVHRPTRRRGRRTRRREPHDPPGERARAGGGHLPLKGRLRAGARAAARLSGSRPARVGGAQPARSGPRARPRLAAMPAIPSAATPTSTQAGIETPNSFHRIVWHSPPPCRIRATTSHTGIMLSIVGISAPQDGRLPAGCICTQTCRPETATPASATIPTARA